ncbi:MAG: helicase [Planctomycetaceae bacterium]|nr:helicase [Planctomycetaceae bacterium]
MPDAIPTRDELANDYLDQLEFDPYPVQEEALLTWFTSDQGVLVCAPTGTGKTLIAEAALFEALKTGKRAYYTTPLIALTEQKLQEMRAAAVRWGFREDDVGLVTGNRRVNPDAAILVVVAEILFNRLLHREQFEFDDVAAVVMDEFHSFNDYERGIVWELTLGLLPDHIRLLLLSATVGNAYEFTSWLRRAHDRSVELVESDQRKVPLTYQWVGDSLLTEHLESMAGGDDEARFTPALVFCFNREQCWNVAETLKGKSVLHDGQQKRLQQELAQHNWSEGAGPKLKQILYRGVGVHHAGVLPKYRRIVEELFQQKLLSVCVCTETLAAGINLPARSVVIPELLKGPPAKKKLIEASAAHQMFGRAGRPQFDTQGFVFGLAHEDDVKIARWRVKYDQIPEDTKDPGLRKQKKALKKKMPKRRANQQYWTEQQFNQLRDAPPSKLASRGPLPWRLLAYLLDASPEVDRIRKLVGKRLMDDKQLEAGQKALDRSLMTLWRAGYVELEPEPPREGDDAETVRRGADGESFNRKPEACATLAGAHASGLRLNDEAEADLYRPEFAHPTEAMDRLLAFRGVNPLFGVFLLNHLGIADRAERIQALESILDMPGSVARFVRVPKQEELPPGPLATTRLDVQLLKLGLVTLEQLGAAEQDEDEPQRRQGDGIFEEDYVWVLTLAEKLRILFDHDFPGVHDVRATPVWAAGELLEFGGDFNNFITSNKLQKQEGVIFRHLLRLILLIAEFQQLCPPDTTEDEWRDDLRDISEQLAACCRVVDPTSTDKTLEQAEQVGEATSQM